MISKQGHFFKLAGALKERPHSPPLVTTTRLQKKTRSTPIAQKRGLESPKPAQGETTSQAKKWLRLCGATSTRQHPPLVPPQSLRNSRDERPNQGWKPPRQGRGKNNNRSALLAPRRKGRRKPDCCDTSARCCRRGGEALPRQPERMPFHAFLAETTLRPTAFVDAHDAGRPLCCSRVRACEPTI